MDKALLEQLKQLRDELKVQFHLFSMEAKEKWEEMEITFQRFEKELEKALAEFGQFNEEFWVGEKADVEQMVADYQRIKSLL